MQKTTQSSPFPSLEGLPDLGVCQGPALSSDDECFSLWEKYAMPDNIAKHSLLVASIAEKIALRAKALGVDINVDSVRQSALLHDLGKAYSLRYGGSHAAIGACWVVAETGNYTLAQGVLHHVAWPWPLPTGKEICALPLLVLYADKRAKHDSCVTLAERALDLRSRYGKSQASLEIMEVSFRQVQELERCLADFLQWEDLDAYSFDYRGMVHGA